MTQKERAEKCNIAIKVLDQVAKGINVPLATKMNACQNAIQALCQPDSRKPG